MGDGIILLHGVTTTYLSYCSLRQFVRYNTKYFLKKILFAYSKRGKYHVKLRLKNVYIIPFPLRRYLLPHFSFICRLIDLFVRGKSLIKTISFFHGLIMSYLTHFHSRGAPSVSQHVIAGNVKSEAMRKTPRK